MRKCLTAFSVSLAWSRRARTSSTVTSRSNPKTARARSNAAGKLLVIDGGFSRAYQKETGIAGYTLIYNSYGLILAAHDPFESTEAAIEKESDIHSESRMVKWVPERKCVGDTDIGRELKEKIKDLEKLLNAYYSGAIAEKFTR
mgnify:CR=1 FL=1